MLPAHMRTFSYTSYAVLQLLFTTNSHAKHVAYQTSYRREYTHDLIASSCLLYRVMSAHHDSLLRMLTQHCTA
jgi:hypothetical protein